MTPMEDREFAMILEGLRSDFRVFGEGLQLFREETGKRFDEVNRRVDKLSLRIDGMDQRINQMSLRIDGMDQRVDVLTQRIDGMDQRVDVLTQRVDGMSLQIDEMSKRIDGTNRTLKDLFDAHEKWLQDHEVRIKAVESTLKS